MPLLRLQLASLTEDDVPYIKAMEEDLVECQLCHTQWQSYNENEMHVFR